MISANSKLSIASHAQGGPRRLDPATVGDHLDRLYRAALAYCRSREAAEDLVQDTYVRVLSRPRFLRNDDDLGYLMQVLRNTFISNQRRARSRPGPATADEPDQIEDVSTPTPHEVAETRLVYQAIAALPPHFRDALVAVDIAGLRYREAASALGIPQGTAMTRVFRARQKVADALRPQTPAEERVPAGTARV
jgi:RNA polymerase sigma-70 factor, ECF subfamily